MLCLSGFELYSRWVLLKLVQKKLKPKKIIELQQIYEFHILEPRNEAINAKNIIGVQLQKESLKK